MVKGLASTQQPTSSCEHCILSKSHRKKIVPRVSYRVKAPLHIVHTDLRRQMKTPSSCGNV